ncbi:uncharacterized protein LOC130797266 [Amaranthus tricolor]|uniref:uncharacterized protein LOC130797266 n=1 Tax=Amaranthus tricolor TaxID=29722 RepID=UPI00258F4C4A|nr:uncharacterized protein LOC130797266 [Amaranthus tricolor]XP_057515782.1 uncharacterized protein LOC130797266 [Amaranthus tricolor]XP_057515783.1 uncharacterized protein LOC130797266 [Amaranthus tricolor]XP_057515784.1 uncharacterized protein LOC130797266 [Amaranthus tricolor]
MAGIYCFSTSMVSASYYSRITNTTRCCLNPSNNHNIKNQTPQLLKFAVNGVTEILRFFSSSNNNREVVVSDVKEELLISGVDDVLAVLKSDYDKAYFVTGIFTSSIYAEDCLFEDPTIKFRGRDLYSRNLQLLVPFFEQPSIVLRSIANGVNSETNFVLATWSLRTYLKLPWKPLIAIEGSTTYDLDDDYKIVRHAERWNVSAVEAVGQIFTPGFTKP